MLPTSYLKKLNKFSISEQPFILLYSLCSYFLNRLPKNIVETHLVFRNLLKNGINVHRKGTYNLVSGFEGINMSVLIKRNSSDARVLNQIFIEEEYKPIVNLFKKYKITPQKIIDAGANIGLTSLYLNSVYDGVESIAIEPNESTFLRMRKNLEINSCRSVLPLNVGLWSSDTYLSPANTFRDGQDWSFSLKEEKIITPKSIKARCIKGLLNEYDWESVDLLKMDIEGAESEIFKSSNAVAEWLPHIKILAVEIHDEFDCRDRILNILSSKQFDIEYHGELVVGINQKFTLV